jgi:hypothetical protein
MQEICLDVTFQGSEPLGAYLYLPRQNGDRSVHAEQHRAGLIADLTADGRLIGIEIGYPDLVTVEAVNEVLDSYGLEPLDPEELAPLLRVA